MKRMVQGIGINDAGYKIKRSENGVIVWKCPFYERWANILQRVSNNWATIKPTYAGVTVCDDWKLFSNFRRWMVDQDWEGKELDKDILHPSKRLYSPETCVFVPRCINSFILDKNSSGYMSGVKWYEPSKCFISSCSNPLTMKCKSLGYFSDELVAHLVWKEHKLKIIPQLCQKYQVEERVKNALELRYSLSKDEADYLESNIESARIFKRYRVEQGN